MANRARLQGSRPVHPSSATATEPVHPELRLQATVVLEPEGLPKDHPVAKKAAEQDAAWPTERPVLTLDELEILYAPPERVVDEVLAFATAQDLEVVEVSSRRHDVILEGPAAAFDSAFQVVQQLYDHEIGSYRSHDGPIHLPEALEKTVVDW